MELLNLLAVIAFAAVVIVFGIKHALKYPFEEDDEETRHW